MNKKEIIEKLEAAALKAKLTSTQLESKTRKQLETLGKISFGTAHSDSYVDNISRQVVELLQERQDDIDLAFIEAQADLRKRFPDFSATKGPRCVTIWLDGKSKDTEVIYHG